MKNAIAYVGMNTPWGKAQDVTTIVDGEIMSVGTSGHGGIKLSRKLNALVPDYMRRKGGWYEEDCEWAIPFVVFKDRIPNFQQSAVTTLRNWFPTMYEQFFGEVIPAGLSFVKDERTWKIANANKIQVLAAWGAGSTVENTVVPAGKVIVVACVGGRTNVAPYESAGPEAYYLVDDAEYAQRNGRTFIVDPTRHPQINVNMASYIGVSNA